MCSEFSKKGEKSLFENIFLIKVRKKLSDKDFQAHSITG
jgi:hypothetical protein